MYCTQCGAELTALVKFCGKCGAKTAAATPAPSVSAESQTPPQVEASPATREAPSEEAFPSAGADAEPSVPSADTQSGFPIAETRRRVMPLVLSIVALVCLGVWLAASPYITLWRLNTALTNSDVETLNALVDWGGVRAEVKSELATVIGGVTETSDVGAISEFALVATMFGDALIGSAVDMVVTAENMGRLSAGQFPDVSQFGFLGDALANGMLSAAEVKFDAVKGQLASRVEYSTGYTSPMAFEVRISALLGGDVDNPEDNTIYPVARILMRRSGLGWTVRGVQFAAEVQNLIKSEQNDTSTMSPVTLPDEPDNASPAPRIYDDNKGCMAVNPSLSEDVDCPGFGVLVDFQTGALDQDTSNSGEFLLPVGDYIVTARCDDDCTDLDLAVSRTTRLASSLTMAPGVAAPAESVATDIDLDDFPTVRFSVTQAWFDANPGEEYRITVSMVECSINPCGFFVAIKTVNAQG